MHSFTSEYRESLITGLLQQNEVSTGNAVTGSERGEHPAGLSPDRQQAGHYVPGTDSVAIQPCYTDPASFAILLFTE